MSKSILVDSTKYLEVKCYFIKTKSNSVDFNGNSVEEDKLIYVPSEMIENIDHDQNLNYVIGLFRKPNYKSFYIVKTKSISIDPVSKTLFTSPIKLENEIINEFLFAIQDRAGNRTDITDENKRDYIGSVEACIINGLAKEFVKASGVDFSD